MTEHTPGPSSAGRVVLDVGPGVGALVLHTPAERDRTWRHGDQRDQLHRVA